MEIRDLLTKFFKKECSEEEIRKLYFLISSPENEQGIKEELLSNLNDFKKEHYEDNKPNFETIYCGLQDIIYEKDKIIKKERLAHKLSFKSTVSRLVIGVSSVAAVLFIMFYIGAKFFSDNDQQDIVQNLATTDFEIKAPLGSISEVILNDGSVVILNAGSSIKYRSDYNLKNRDLILDGEAYIKAAKNTEIPLVIKTGILKIKAIGTEFNVNAYSGEPIIETTLVKGSVEISTNGERNNHQALILKPAQKAVYSSSGISIVPTDVEQITAWTTNKLIIRNENLESLTKKLRRKYNVYFVFKDEEIKNLSFTGILLDETVQQVLDVIKLTSPVDYRIDGKTIILLSRKEY